MPLTSSNYLTRSMYLLITILALSANASPTTALPEYCDSCPAPTTTTSTVGPAFVYTTVVVTAYTYPSTTTTCTTTSTTTVYYQTQTQTQVKSVGNGYCSTLYANGPGLPTARQGSCGLIWVEEASAGAKHLPVDGPLWLGFVKVAIMVIMWLFLAG